MAICEEGTHNNWHSTSNNRWNWDVSFLNILLSNNKKSVMIEYKKNTLSDSFKIYWGEIHDQEK